MRIRDANSDQPKNKQLLFSWSTLFCVVLLATIIRVINALLLQTQFDPDEYWQNLEPAYCMAFHEKGYSCHMTWEWTRRAPSSVHGWMERLLRGPARSYVAILPTYWLYAIVQIPGWDFPWMISKGPLFLNAVLVAAPVDVSIWIAAHFIPASKMMYSNDLANISLFFSLTSWFQGYALIRTYSNSLEAMLLAVGVALVSPELLSNEKFYRFQHARSSLAFLLGGISVAVRFSSLAAWVPLGLLLAIQQSPTKRFQQALYIAIPCVLFGAIGISISLVLDRLFYGFWVAPCLASFQFNAILGMGALYGTHPFHWYFTAGIPAITGLLLPLVAMSFWKLLRQLEPSCSRAQSNIWTIVFSYTLILSMSSHKEFRFLLPVLPLFCLLAASQWAEHPMRSKSKGWIKLAFVVMNIGALIFLGLCHQRAPLDVNRRIVKLVQQQYASLPSRGSIVTVHYLMGCHSTPLYSHLHVPSVRVVAKTLDCSPDCRSNKTCESDAFERDPKHFVEDLYFSSLKGPMCLGGIDQVCNDQDDNPVLSETPDFVVVSSQNAVGLRPQLATMGLMEIDRFFHSIHDLTVGAFGKQRESSVDQEYRRLPIFNMASLSFEEIVLFHTQREHDQRAL